MEFRLASVGDLPGIRRMYTQIVKNMAEQHIQIWDDVYPCVCFESDIAQRRLYLMLEGAQPVSAFALCEAPSAEGCVAWADRRGKALYMNRLGVHPGYAGRGIGRLMLAKARQTAAVLGVEYLRLFVAAVNLPAIRLYTRNGFIRAGGFYDEVVDEGHILREYGYEIRL